MMKIPKITFNVFLKKPALIKVGKTPSRVFIRLAPLLPGQVEEQLDSFADQFPSAPNGHTMMLQEKLRDSGQLLLHFLCTRSGTLLRKRITGKKLDEVVLFRPDETGYIDCLKKFSDALDILFYGKAKGRGDLRRWAGEFVRAFDRQDYLGRTNYSHMFRDG